MTLPRVRRAIKLIVKPKPSFEIPKSVQDPLYKFPHEYSFYSALTGTPVEAWTTLASGGVQGSRGKRRSARLFQSPDDALSPTRGQPLATPSRSIGTGRYLQVPSPASPWEPDRHSIADPPFRATSSPRGPGRLGRVMEEVSECVWCLDDSNPWYAGDAVVRVRSQLVDTPCNKRSCTEPIGAENCDSPRSSYTVYFDALETPDASRPCSISDAAETQVNNGNGPSESNAQFPIQAPDETSRFNLPFLRIEGPSPDTSPMAPSSPTSPLLFSRVQSDSDSDPDGEESPLARFPSTEKGPKPCASRNWRSPSMMPNEVDSRSRAVYPDRRAPTIDHRSSKSYLGGSRTASNSNKLSPPNRPRTINHFGDDNDDEDPAAVPHQGRFGESNSREPSHIRSWLGRLCRETLRKRKKFFSWGDRDREVARRGGGGGGCSKPDLGPRLGRARRQSAPLVGATGPTTNLERSPELTRRRLTKPRPASMPAFTTGPISTSTPMRSMGRRRRASRFSELDYTTIFAPNRFSKSDA